MREMKANRGTKTRKLICEGEAVRVSLLYQCATVVFVSMNSLGFGGEGRVPYPERPMTTIEKMPWAIRMGRSKPNAILIIWGVMKCSIQCRERRNCNAAATRARE